MIKIAIVEDDAKFQKSLRRVVESNPEYKCSAVYGTGAGRWRIFPKIRPML